MEILPEVITQSRVELKHQDFLNAWHERHAWWGNHGHMCKSLWPQDIHDENLGQWEESAHRWNPWPSQCGQVKLDQLTTGKETGQTKQNVSPQICLSTNKIANLYFLTGERFKNAGTYQALPNHLPYQVDRFQENDVLRILLGMFACATVQGWFFLARLPDPCKSLWDPFLYHRWPIIGITVNRVNLSFAPDTSQIINISPS